MNGSSYWLVAAIDSLDDQKKFQVDNPRRAGLVNLLQVVLPVRQADRSLIPFKLDELAIFPHFDFNFFCRRFFSPRLHKS